MGEKRCRLFDIWVLNRTKNSGFSPQNGWFIGENPIKMDDLGGFPLFLVQHPYWHQMFVSYYKCMNFGDAVDDDSIDENRKRKENR